MHLSDGIHALDNACPYEGYGLTTGYLTEGVLTCAWHNWKFEVSSGECVQGEESVTTHRVDVDDDGTISVSLTQHDPQAERNVRLTSLRQGITDGYNGQISRDAIRLLHASANPGELVWEAVAFGAPRGEWGWGHSIAVAADCLDMVSNGVFTGTERAFPIVHAIAGIAEEAHGEQVGALAEPATELPSNPAAALRTLVERELTAEAQSLVRCALRMGFGPQDLHPWFLQAVSDHHLSYGHGSIYVQKAFQLLDHLGWERADTVLPFLVTGLVSGTREDLLPPMKPFMKALQSTDLFALGSVETDTQWTDTGQLRHSILDSADRTLPLTAAVQAIREGAGVDGLLDVVVAATSERMLRYDVASEHVLADDFNWLDITHGLTYAESARWHHARQPGPESLRLALFCVHLVHWTGRYEFRHEIGRRHEIALPEDTLVGIGRTLQREAILGPGSSFLVQAHALKSAVAATNESTRSGNDISLRAVARYLQEKDHRRYVAATVAQSIAFLDGKGDTESGQ